MGGEIVVYSFDMVFLEKRFLFIVFYTGDIFLLQES